MPPRIKGRRFQPVISGFAAAWLVGAPAFLTAGCANGQETQDETQEEASYIYCVDESGNILDPALCDDSGYYNGFPVYYWITTSSHPVGYHVPASQRRGASYVRVNDPAARARAGVPRTGRIGGTTVSHSGGFGNGSGDSEGG